MTIQTKFFNWATSGINYQVAPYEDLSPNLRQLGNYFMTFGGQGLGWDDNDRDIRSGGAISSHAYGAAFDWRYEPNWLPGTSPTPVSRQFITDQLLPWLVNYSAELMIDAIHDYVGDRIWRAGRTSNVNEAYTTWWKKQHGAGSGMGESWARYIHVETTKDGFGNTTPISSRGIPLVGGSQPADTFVCKLPQPTLKLGSNGDTVRALQDHIRFYGCDPGNSDGDFGPKTELAVKCFQSKIGSTADGIYGPKTYSRACSHWKNNPERIAHGW